jgi:hypothetical protein
MQLTSMALPVSLCSTSFLALLLGMSAAAEALSATLFSGGVMGGRPFSVGFWVPVAAAAVVAGAGPSGPGPGTGATLLAMAAARCQCVSPCCG